ncbi:MAG TPA: hypothetical protein VFV50_11160, partial [Bdellovibrionales bacterium]|nr:hypothetical protein [Bdellovibrionales bacterium]
WKVPLKNPKSLSQVRLETPYPTLDGLVLLTSNEVVGIQNGKDNKVLRFKTGDDWNTATTVQNVASEMRFPTTGVKADGRVYVLEGKLDELFADPAKAVSGEYLIKGFPQ